MVISKSRQPMEPKSTLWKSLLTSLIAFVVFFALLEGVLALFGVQPVMQKEDPFVGFSANVPLFVDKKEAQGRPVMITAPNKLTFFNHQQFPRDKQPGTYRIFCLGGSTTYGRPYDDRTSFAGWLRELLPAADDKRRWEVINAGGISYASYRVANLMKELVRYEPDLFIIYTGHNEFLEERTYGALRDMPVVIRKTASLLARTRTWSAMSGVMNEAGIVEGQKRRKVEMTGEVNTILSRSAGTERYHRDDPLKKQVTEHYRVSLERIAEISRSAGVQCIFVTPASNLKDSSPFKSQHSPGMSTDQQATSEQLLAHARELIDQNKESEALEILDQAIAIDPRYAELHYRRGKVLFGLQRYTEAAWAFRRARDEDVCPLRALTVFTDIVEEVEAEKGIALMNFVAFIEQRSLAEQGHPVPGEEFFLDHVHLTIAGNRMLAVELIKTMTSLNIVEPSADFDKTRIAEIAARVEGSLDRKEHAQALANLARLLKWAGKIEDAGRLARQVITYKDIAPSAARVAATILASVAKREGETGKALQYYRAALHGSPANAQFHLQYGLTHLNDPLRNFEVAAGHILLAAVFWPQNDMSFMTFGLAMAQRGRYPLAYPYLKEAVRINPQNREASSALARLRQLLEPAEQKAGLPNISLDKYPSGAPSKIVQVRPGAKGGYIPDGIWTEWHENGELKRFVDYVDGKPHGLEINWNPAGEVVSRYEYRHGKKIKSQEV